MDLIARGSELVKSLGRKLALSLLLAFPVAAYVSGGATFSNTNLDHSSCIVHREFNFLGILAFRFDTYDRECSEAQAVLEIMKSAAYKSPPDQGMIAVAIGAWREQYPRINELVEEINNQLLKKHNSNPAAPIHTD